MENEELEQIQLSSEELALFFDLLNQINENIQALQTEELEPELIEHEQTELYQLEQLNVQLHDLLNQPEPELIEHEFTELYQLEMLNSSMEQLNEHNSNTYYTDIADLNNTMQELSTSFSEFQEYHWNTNQLYQFTNLLIFPLGLIYFIYRILKNYMP